VVANADLHRAGLDLEIRMTDGRQRAWPEPDTDGPATINSLLRDRANLLKTAALRSLRAADLPHEDFTGDTAPLFPLMRRCGADVIVCDHGRNLDAVLRGQPNGHLHIHVVAGIVAIEADDARAAIGFADGIVKTLRGRR